MEHIFVVNQITLSVNQNTLDHAISMGVKFLKSELGYRVPLNELFGINTPFTLYLPPESPNLLTVESNALITPENLVEAKLMFDFALDLRHYLDGSYEDFEHNFPEFVKLFASVQNAYVQTGQKVGTLIR